MILTWGHQARPVGLSTLEQVQELKDQAEAAVDAAVGYATRAEAEAAQVPAPVKILRIGALAYRRDATGTALTTADGQNWSPEGDVFFEHWPSDMPAADRINAAFALGAASGQTVRSRHSGVITFTGRIIVPDGLRADLNWLTLQAGDATSGIDYPSTVWLQRVVLSAAGVTDYVGPLLRIDDTAGYSRQAQQYNRTKDIILAGPSWTAPAGTAIQLRGAGPKSAGITGVIFEGVTIQSFAVGLELDGRSSWVNSNYFRDFRFGGCVTSINMLGEANGNQLDYIIQPNTGSRNAYRAIYCEGQFNLFRGNIWDWYAAGSDIAVEFGPASARNDMTDQCSRRWIVDHAPDQNRANFIRCLAEGEMSMQSGWSAPPTTEHSAALGNADDALAYADLDASVSLTGDAPATGTLANVFRPGASSLAWAELSTATITINLQKRVNYWTAIGAMFGFDNIPDFVMIETSLDGVAWTTWREFSGNRSYLVSRASYNFVANAQYIRFTISNDAPKAVNIQRLFGFSSDRPGRVSFATGGGTLHGPLIVNGPHAQEQATSERASYSASDDLLIYADRRGGSVSVAPAVSTGAPINMLRMGTSFARWQAATSVTVTVDLGTVTNYLQGAGIGFGFGQIADGVLIERSVDNATWTTVLNVAGNKNPTVSAVRDGFFGNVRYLRYTLTNPTPSDIQVQRLYAYAPVAAPVGLLPSYAATHHGDMRVNGAMMVKDGMPGPTAVAGYAALYVDSADRTLKVRFADGVTISLGAHG